MTDFGLAQVHASLGNRDEALGFLERAFEGRFSWLPWLKQTNHGLDRPFASFTSDARYRNLVRRMNLAA